MCAFLNTHCPSNLPNMSSLSRESTNVKNMISSFASYSGCHGFRKTKLYEHCGSMLHHKTTKCIVSSNGDIFEMFDGDRCQELMKNKMKIPISANNRHMRDFTISDDGSEIYCIHFVDTFDVWVYSSSGTFLRSFELPLRQLTTENIDINKFGQLVILCTDERFIDDLERSSKLIYFVYSVGGELISKTFMELNDHFFSEHDKVLISPDIIDGLIFVGIAECHAIYAVDAENGRCVRKMYGDVVFIKKSKTDYVNGEFDINDSHDGMVVNYDGTILYEAGQK